MQVNGGEPEMVTNGDGVAIQLVLSPSADVQNCCNWHPVGAKLEPASGRSCIRKSCNGRWESDRRRVTASSSGVSATTAGEEVALHGASCSCNFTRWDEGSAAGGESMA